MRISSKRLLIEALVATAIVLVGVGVATRAPRVGLGVLHPHPIWLVVLALSALYGARGLVVAVPVAWGALALMALPWHASPSVAFTVLAMPAELGALAAAVIVSWIASVHERKARALEEKMVEVTGRASRDAAALDELRRAALALRARNDRLDLSLTFLRDVALRIDSGDLGAASEAALSLVVARLGARAAAVELVAGDDRHLNAIASVGIWNAGSAGERPDVTCAEALRTGQPVRAIDLQGAGPEDSDLAAPIVVDGDTAGVLSVRGVPRVGAAALRDLTVVAEWLALASARKQGNGRLQGGLDIEDRPATEHGNPPVRESAPRPVSALHLSR